MENTGNEYHHKDKRKSVLVPENAVMFFIKVIFPFLCINSDPGREWRLQFSSQQAKSY